MKNTSEPEMRAEYDFSRARRSRYASRLSDEERREILTRSATLDAQLQFARALQEVQGLEALLVAFLVLGFDQGIEAAGRTAVAVLEGRDRRTVPELTTSAGLDQNFSLRMSELAAERSWLVHKSGLLLSPQVPDTTELADLAVRLQELADQAGQLGEELMASLQRHLAHSGLTSREVEKRTEETIHRWLAA